MTQPAYVNIAGIYARRIRTGELAPGRQLPTLAEIGERHGVSDIVARKAIELLQSQGLVRSVRRRGIFVSDRPNLVRVSPERQTETAEDTLRHESELEVQINREEAQVPVPEDLADAFGLSSGEMVTRVTTRVMEGGHPVSISDTYQPLDVVGASTATDLEESIADRLPTASHAEWLRTTPGDLVKTVHQRFFTSNERLIMVSDISYPQGRFDAFLFRMTLRSEAEASQAAR